MAADLSFRIGAELTEIKGALASLRQDFARVGQAANQAGGRGALQGLEQGAGRAARAVGGLVAGFASLAGAIALIGAADELNTLNARIRLVTGSTEEYNRAQVALFDLAQRTRSSLGDTINTYVQIGQAVKDAGVGQEVLLGVVETINQAVQLSGVNAASAQAALVQLTQGLGSGTLRGEELNSVLEQTGKLADVIARGMGITRSQLREYGEQGKITAEQVINALQSQRAEVDAQFAQLPLTVGQSVTLLRNSSLQLLGAFNESTGATAGLASVIKDLADFLASDAALGTVVEFAATWSSAFRLITSDVQAAVDIIGGATRGITSQGETIFGFLARAFRELPLNVRAGIQIATVNIAAFIDSTIASFGALADYIRAIFDPRTTIDQVRAQALRTQAAIEQARQESVDQALRERQQALNDAEAARRESEQRRQRARSTPGSTAAGTFRTRPDDAAAKAAAAERKAALDAEEKLAKDSAQRALGILQGYYEDAQLAAEQYFAARQAIELAALDRSIAIEQRRRDAAAPGSADRVMAETEIKLLEAAKTDIVAKAQRDRAAAEREIEQQLTQARAQQLDNEGRTAEAARIRLEAQYRDLLARLGKDSEGAKLVQKLIDTGVAQAQFDEVKAQFDRTVADLQARQQAIANQQQTGAITNDTARQQQSDAQRAAVERLRALNAELQRLAADPAALPAVRQAAEEANAAFQRLQIDGLTGLDLAIVDLLASLANLQDGFAQSLTGAGVDALTNLFTDLASGSKSAKDSILDFVRSFVASMAQIAARALATYAVLQLLKAAGVPTPALALVRHSGGMVTASGGPRRSVNPLIFAGAPRFHAGGMVGLKPGEVPAILQTGEEVLARNDPRNAANGGGGGGGTRIINVLDPGLVQDYMTSSSGEKTFVNLIERNAGSIRQIMAG